VKNKKYLLELLVEKNTFPQFKKKFTTARYISTADWFLIYDEIDKAILLYINDSTAKKGYFTCASYQVHFKIIPGSQSNYKLDKACDHTETKFVFAAKILAKKEVIKVEKDQNSLEQIGDPKDNSLKISVKGKVSDRANDWKKLRN
jgi:hypothetical protein